jgi:hypothetical protein
MSQFPTHVYCGGGRLQVWPAGPNRLMRIVYNGRELPLGKLEKMSAPQESDQSEEYVSRGEFHELLRQMQRFASRVDSEFGQVRKLLDAGD